MESKFTTAHKSGRAFNGAHRDSGTIIHIILGEYNKVDTSWDKSLCGTIPGYRGNGWNFVPEQSATCDKCISKQSKIQTP